MSRPRRVNLPPEVAPRHRARVPAGTPRPGADLESAPIDSALAPHVAVGAVERAGYAPVLNGGFQSIAASAHEMHTEIADTVFGAVLRVPGIAAPTRLAQSVHDAIAEGVYGAVRRSADAAFGLAGQVERLARDPAHVPGAAEQSLRSALNAVVGDALHAGASGVAVPMELRAGTAPLGVTPVALAMLRPRVCLFVHGLGCNESSWWRGAAAWIGSPWHLGGSQDALPIHYAPLLEREFGVSAIHLRYNTGLSLDTNAARLAALLERAASAAPQVTEWLLIGHSMGGLVARGAHAHALREQLAWPGKAPMIVCLGSPHQGAPLERIGRLAAAALQVAAVTRPLARLANARSQGIRDLRRGMHGRADAGAPALRFVAATLATDPTSRVGKALGSSIGDGLVPTDSATDADARGDVQRVVLAGLGHMDLLNHPRVYEAIRPWIAAGR